MIVLGATKMTKATQAATAQAAPFVGGERRHGLGQVTYDPMLNHLMRSSVSLGS
jgi:hypothetical protein